MMIRIPMSANAGVAEAHDEAAAHAHASVELHTYGTAHSPTLVLPGGRLSGPGPGVCSGPRGRTQKRAAGATSAPTARAEASAADPTRDVCDASAVAWAGAVAPVDINLACATLVIVCTESRMETIHRSTGPLVTTERRYVLSWFVAPLGGTSLAVVRQVIHARRRRPEVVRRALPPVVASARVAPEREQDLHHRGVAGQVQTDVAELVAPACHWSDEDAVATDTAAQLTHMRWASGAARGEGRGGALFTSHARVHVSSCLHQHRQHRAPLCNDSDAVSSSSSSSSSSGVSSAPAAPSGAAQVPHV
jgi:hypothetical protein